MLEDLEANIIEDEGSSPFYGIYFGDKLVGRMSLYQVEAKFDRYFSPPQNYFELWKLEVLPQYRNKGFGKTLVDFAKGFGLPIKANPKNQSSIFWEKRGFTPVEYEMERANKSKKPNSKKLYCYEADSNNRNNEFKSVIFR